MLESPGTEECLPWHSTPDFLTRLIFHLLGIAGSLVGETEEGRKVWPGAQQREGGAAWGCAGGPPRMSAPSPLPFIFLAVENKSALFYR